MSDFSSTPANAWLIVDRNGKLLSIDWNEAEAIVELYQETAFVDSCTPYALLALAVREHVLTTMLESQKTQVYLSVAKGMLHDGKE